MSTITLYHYTNKEGIEGISQSDIIETSRLSRRDAVFGEGVYLTSLSHRESKETIVANNWGITDQAKIKKEVREGRVDYNVKIKIPKKDGKLEDISGNTGRDIFLYKGEIDVTQFTHQFYQGTQVY